MIKTNRNQNMMLKFECTLAVSFRSGFLSCVLSVAVLLNVLNKQTNKNLVLRKSVNKARDFTLNLAYQFLPHAI